MGYFILVFFILTFDALGAQEIEQFVCDETGRFENPTDDTCRTFYLCSLTREGDLVQTQYSCPDGTYFSPTNGICSRNFSCQRSSIGYEIDTEKGDNVHYHCQDETQYKFKCTRSGRFANLLDPNCKKYHLCSLTQNGFYVETELQCPDGTLFDPNTQKCHTKYQCPCDFIDWETSKGKIFFSKEQFQKEWHHFKVTEFSCTSTDIIKEFECQEAGVFADERDVTCTDYFMCSQLSNGKYVQSFFSCPHGSAFDPFAKRCSSRYECSCQIETSTIPSNPNKLTTSYTELIPSPQSCFTPKRPFACKKRGRFPNRRDVSCSTYYLCDLSRRSELKRKLYRCPRCLYFNPMLGKCTDDYICPCNAIEGSGQSSTNPTNRSTRSVDTTTRPITRITTDCRMPSPSRPFRCTSRGRFPDRRDTTCSSYFLCTSLKRNIFKRSSYKCMRNLKFDPSTQRCSTSYECPCTNISMTSSLNMSTIPLPTTKRSTISSEPTSSSHSSTSFSTATAHDCTVPTIDRPFRCRVRGRFPDRRDLTCVSYFLCATDWRGILRRTSVRCQRNTRFDPTVRRCTARYVCPCIRTSITATLNMTTMSLPTTQRSTISSEPITSTTSLNTTTRLTTETEPSINTGTTPTSRTTVTTESPNISTSSNISTSTQISNTTTSSSTATTDDCTVPPIHRPFRCRVRGRFPDRRDVTCVSYFLCATDWRGILRRTSVRCQRNTRFDPTVRRCTARYVCPCIRTSITATQNMTTMSLPTTQGSTISSEPITSTTSLNTTTRPTTETEPSINTGTTASSRTTVTTESPTISTSSNISTSTQISNTTTRSSTATTDDCTVPSIDRPFRCRARGRFPDRRDVTCVSYFLCSTDWQGILRRTSVRCQRNTRFDPTIQRCSTGYVCPCIGTSITTTQNMTTFSLPTTQRSTISSEPITSTTSLNTTTRPTTETEPSINTGTTATSRTTVTTESPTISTSSNMSTSTQISNTTTSSSTATTDDCRVPPIDRPFRCRARGRFPDRRDVTCVSYFLCSTDWQGLLRRTSVRCQRNTRFDPTIQRCTSGYVCPCIGTSITTTQNMTTFSLPTTQRSTISSEPITSTTSLNTTTRPTTETEPSINTGTTATSRTTVTTESPTISTSSNMSTSTQISNTTTSSSTATTDDCTVPPIDRPFRCISSGRFPDRRDVTCVSYFLCATDWRGILRRTSVRCQRNTRFDSTVRRCSARYVCPCIRTSITATQNMTTMSLPTTQRSTISSEPITSTTSLNTTTRLTTETEPSINTGTTSTSRTTVTTESPTISTSSNVTTSTQISNTTTSSSTATTDDCTVPPIDRPFRCRARGRFPDRRDVTCVSYFLCSTDWQGILRRTSVRCQRNNRFDPTIQRCSTGYVCPCIGTSITTTQNMTTFSLPTTQRSTMSSGPITSTTSTNTTIRQTTETIPSINTGTTATSRSTTSITQSPTISTPFNVSSSTPISNTTTSFSTSTSVDCIVHSSGRPFRCTSIGIFPNRRDTTCSTYFQCYLVRTGSFRRHFHQCGENLKFDPSSRKCSDKYVCPCESTSISSPSTISSEPTISSTNLNTTTSQTKVTVSSTITRPTATSRSTTLLTQSPTISTTSSVSISMQTSNTTTSFSTGTTDDCTVPPIDRPFRCTARGRFPDKRDVTCVSYFLCATDWRGILRRTSVRCQRNTRFDPTVRRCTARYVCPCIRTSITATQNMTTMSLPTTQRSTISSEPITSTTSLNTTTRPTTETEPSINTGTTATSRTTVTTESPTISTSSNMSTSTQISDTTTSSSAATTDDCTVPPIDRPFRCRASGRFPDRRDVTCVSYFLCATDWRGILRRTSVRCQRNTRFDPTVRRCTARYVCPCIRTSITATQNMTTMSLPTTQRSTISSEPITSTTSLNTTTRRTTETEPSINTGTTASSRTTVTTESPTISTSSNISTSTQISNTTTSSSTATTDDCRVPPIDRPFRCRARGRFPDRRDVTCVSYFLCSTDWQGILRRTSVRCQRNTRFDPTIQRCTSGYVCPCIGTSITTTQNMTTFSLPTTQRSTISSEPITSTTSTNTTTRQTTETIPSINTGTTATSPSTTSITQSPTISTPFNVSSSTPISNTTTSFSTSTSVDCIVHSSGRPFRCTSIGIFPNRRDTTCSTYFQCYLVRTGSFRRHFHQCGENLKFDPSLRKCSDKYVCPCESTSISSPSTISSEPTISSTNLNTTMGQTTVTVSSTITRPTATSRSTTLLTQSPTISTTFSVSISTQASNTTTSFSTGTTDDCTVPPIDRPFRCTARGRFPDRRDVTCVSYFLCATDWRGILRRTSVRCQRNTRFDPTVRRCTARYVCPCIRTSITATQNMTTMSLPTTQRSTISSEPITSTTSLNTTTRRTTETEPSINTRTTDTSRTTVTTESPTISTSSNISTSTQISNTTISSSTATTDDCRVPPIDRPFRCRATGRFPDRRDVTCVSYFLCSTDWQGILRRTSVRCRRNTRFDPTIQRCSTGYVCPCIGTSITTTQNMTTFSLPTTQRSTISSEPITSTTSTNTTTRQTTETIPSINTGTTATSPSTTSITQSPTISTPFNVSSSTPITNTTTSFSTSTSVDCIVHSSDRPFRCTSIGIFPNRRDTTCSTYFQCYLVRTGSFRRHFHQCQRNLKFDPSLRKCSDRYACPCESTTANMTTFSSSSTQPSTVSSEPTISSTNLNTTTSQTTVTVSSTITRPTATSRSTTLSTQSPTISTTSSVSISTQASNTTTSFSTGTTDDCTVPPIDRPFRCTARGRFPDRRDVTCVSYFLCATDWRGILRRSSVRCQRNTRFDPTVRRCTASYVCPCIRTSITATQNMTTMSLPTTQRSTISSEPITSTTYLNTTTRRTTETEPSINTGTTATSRTTVTTESPTISTSSNISTSTQISNTTTSSSTATTDDCRVPPIDRPFRCRATGRFPDRRDVTCVSYFLCSTDWQGILRRTSVRCQRNTRFDPTIQRCSPGYVCPCIGTSITTTQNMTTFSLPTTQRSTISSEPITSTTSTNTTTRQTTETIPSINTGTTATSRSTTSITQSPTISTPFNVSSSTPISNTTTSFSTSTSVDCIVHSSGRPFRCTSIGIFPNRRDTTCSTYFQCYLVRTGSFRRHFHQCGENLKFDPSLRKCSDRYMCPCESATTNMTTFSSPSTISSEPTISSTNLNTTTSQTTVTVSSTNTRPTATSRTTTVATTTQSPTISTSSNVSISTQTSNTTTSFSTGTTDDCTVPPIDRPFRCTSSGRFPDKRDLTCLSYFSCTMDWQGILRRTSSRCQRNTRFDPSIQRCSASYVCPCTHASTTSNLTTLSLPTTDASTRTSHSTTLLPMTETTRYPSSEIITSTRITTDMCIVPSPDYKFNCESEGRFPDIADQRCFSYFLCSYIGGRYVQSQFRCPPGSKFDPYIGKCSFVYDCPCDSTGGTISSSLSTVEACSITTERFICTETGHFKNPTDLSCCTYYICSASQNGTIIQREYSCPEGYKFDPDSRQCTEDYTCPCSVTEPIENFTPPSFECDIPTEEFVCTSVGRFPNRQDVSCCNYILCSISETGSFVKFEYSCPEGTTFDPELQRCSEFYQCPCINTEVSEN